MNVLDRVCIGSFSSARIKAFREAFGDRVCTSMGPGETARLRAAAYGLPVGSFQANCAQIPIKRHGLTLVDPRMIRAANKLAFRSTSGRLTTGPRWSGLLIWGFMA